jgi:type II secretory pathway pseudopilin PulG
VLVVIAVLATLVAPNVFRHVGSAKEATARSQIEMLGAALDAYRLDNGRYPASITGRGRTRRSNEQAVGPRDAQVERWEPSIEAGAGCTAREPGVSTVVCLT